jgi:hypothetical protein
MDQETKEYIDNQFKWLMQLRESDTRAVEKFSKTTDEYNVFHNGLQRQMQEQSKEFVTKPEFSQFIKMVWTVIAFIAVFAISVAVYLKK